MKLLLLNWLIFTSLFNASQPTNAWDKGGVISFMWADWKSSKGSWHWKPKRHTQHPHTFDEIFAANTKAWKEQERKHIVLQSASEACVSCMNHNIGFQRCCGSQAQNDFLVQTKFWKCEKSADLEMNWEILSAATGRILPLSPPVAMDTVVFVS